MPVRVMGGFWQLPLLPPHLDRRSCLCWTFYEILTWLQLFFYWILHSWLEQFSCKLLSGMHVCREVEDFEHSRGKGDLPWQAFLSPTGLPPCQHGAEEADFAAQTRRVFWFHWAVLRLQKWGAPSRYIPAGTQPPTSCCLPFLSLSIWGTLGFHGTA